MDINGVRVPVTPFTLTGIAQGAVASGFVTVKIGGTDVSCLADRGLTTAAGDIVYGRRLGGRILIEGRVWTVAPEPPEESQGPPPPPEPSVRYGKLTIAPVETRSYRPNWGWRNDNDDVYQGEYGNNGNHKGCAFYGSKPHSLAGAEVTKATLKVKRVQAGDFAARTTTLRRITNKTRPGGAPTLTGSAITGPRLAVGSSDTFTLPDAFAQELVDGDAGGLAIFDDDGLPYVRLAGRGAWSSAWVLTIEWRRVT